MRAHRGFAITAAGVTAVAICLAGAPSASATGVATAPSLADTSTMATGVGSKPEPGPAQVLTSQLVPTRTASVQDPRPPRTGPDALSDFASVNGPGAKVSRNTNGAVTVAEPARETPTAPIDAAPKAVAGARNWWRSATVSGTASFGPLGARGGSEVVDVAGHSLAFSPVDATSGTAPSVDASVVTYAEAWPGVDLIERVSATAVGEDIVLKNADVRTTFEFTVTGATPVAEADGAITLKADGITLGRIPAPTVRTHGATRDTPDSGVSMTVADGVVRFSIPTMWLSRQAPDAFPIVIDPPLEFTPNATGLTSVSSNGATRPGTLQAGVDTAGATWRSLAYVSTPTLPATPTSWHLSKVVYQQMCNPATCWPFGSARWASLYGVTGAAGVTPSYGAVTAGTLLDQHYGGFSGADLSAWWGTRAGGWLGTVVDPQGQPEGSLATYTSPFAVFDYFEVPAPTSVETPADGAVVSTTTPTLTAKVTSPQQAAQNDSYRFTLSTSPDHSGAVVDSGWVGPTWTVPAGALTDGATYYTSVIASPTPDGNPADQYTVPPSAPGPTTRLTIHRRLGAGGPSPTDVVGSPPGQTTTPSRGAPSPGEPTASETVDLLTGNLALSVNTHQTKALGGTAGIQLSYDSLESSNTTGTNYGLLASYYDDSPHTHVYTGAPAGRRIDPGVNLATGPYMFSPVNSLPSNSTGYLARWEGSMVLPTGTWKLGGLSSGGMRVYLDGSAIPTYDNWSGAASKTTPGYGASSIVGGGQHTVRVEAWSTIDSTISSKVQLWAMSGTNQQIVPVSWLTPRATGLPPGWKLSANPQAVRWDRATDLGGQILVQGSGGDTESFLVTSPGVFAPPAGSDDLLTVTGSGRLQLYTSDNVRYEFNGDGTLASMTTVADDRTPAGLQYTYGGTPAVLKTITDPVSGRSTTLSYGGDAACPTIRPAPVGYLCAVSTWDGLTTGFGYNASAQLIEVDNPGASSSLFGYDSASRIASIRDALAYDYIASGRSDIPAACMGSAVACPIDTSITYDTGGKVASITQPSPTMGAVRPVRTYTYGAGTGSVLIAGQGAGVTSSTTATYDDQGRQLTRKTWGIAATATVWDSAERPIAATTSAGLQTSTVRDRAGRVTDTYGPAPVACFAPGGWPLGSSTASAPIVGYLPVANPAGTSGCGLPQVPRQHTAYDENMDGLAAVYYSNGLLGGSAAKHASSTTPPDPVRCPTAGTFCMSWPSGPPAGVGVDSHGAWSMRASGVMTLDVAEDGEQYGLWASGPATLTIDGSQVAAVVPGVSNAISPHLTLAKGQHSIAVTIVGGTGATYVNLAKFTSEYSDIVATDHLSPDYGLVTSTTDADGRKSVTSYTAADGSFGPEMGLPTAVTVDPGGLALTTKTSYEAPAAGFLRRTTETLPAGGVTTYTYYSGTAGPIAAVCGVASTVKQGGQVLSQTDPAPTPGGAGRMQQFVYDAAGRVAGQRIGSTSTVASAEWNCTSYDARDRMTKQTWPGTVNHNQVDLRNVIYLYAVGGNPLVSNVYSNGTSADLFYATTTTVDFLGRIASYNPSIAPATTYTYNQAGELTSTNGLQGRIDTTYLTTGQPSTVAVDGVTRATSHYDSSSGRLTSVTYANGTSATVEYDAQGAQSGLVFTNTATGALVAGNRQTRSAAGKVLTELEDIDGTSLTNPNPAGIGSVDYSYDGAGRLVGASLPGSQATYGYGASQPADGCPNAQAGANSNRTSVTVSPSVGPAVTTRYCYNGADQLTATFVGTTKTSTFAYDDRGNQTKDGALSMTWDASNRLATSTSSTGAVTQYQYDPLDRVARQFSPAGNEEFVYAGYSDVPAATFDDDSETVGTRFIALPAGVTLSLGGNRVDTWSYPDLDGNVIVTAGPSGARLSGPTVYDPWGAPIGVAPDFKNGGYISSRAGYGAEGRPTDAAGIVLMGARALNPVEGRFLSVDPVHGGCANAYVYGFGDPMTQDDPTGQFCWRKWGGVALGLASIAVGITAAVIDAPVWVPLLGIGLGVAAIGTDIGPCVGGDKMSCAAVALGTGGTALGLLPGMGLGGAIVGPGIWGGLAGALDIAGAIQAEQRHEKNC